jgi:PAS domain S-box-containing protein
MRLASEDMASTLDRMRARQIELEAENATLRRTQESLEIARAHYAQLYDLAPVGYCTICAQGLIVQANLAATALLGAANQALLHAPILQFIVAADRDMFELYRQRVVRSGAAQACELRMADVHGRQFWAHLQSTVAQDADGAPQLRTLLSDATQRNQSEAPWPAGPGRAFDDPDLTASLLRAEISHDLRQPLSALGIYANVLKRHVAPAGQPLLAQIKNCLTTLSELLAK